MPKAKVYHMKDSDVGHMRLTSYNRVLIKIVEKNVDRRTDSGIWLIAPGDTDWNPFEHADRTGIIVQNPTTLRKERNHLWKTTAETEVGDRVWFDPMVSENCDHIITEEATYYLLDYFSLHTVRRSDEVVMLNGYCLFDQVDDIIDSPLAFDTGKKDARYGILKYKGSVNEYYYPEISDDENLLEGDNCIFKTPPVLLEGSYHARFDGKSEYRISQRFNICSYIREGKLLPTVNHVIIRPEMPLKTASGIILPNPKANGFGDVYESGYHEVLKDDRVRYQHNAAVVIEHEGETLHIIHFNNLYYKL